MREAGFLIPKRLPVPPSPSSAVPSRPSRAAAFAVPGTLFPHRLVDEVMPTLSGSEWALLCVVVRQTLGWHDPATGGRKTSDWLSHRQLRARTGRGSDAVCSAVDSLVRRDLIEVQDEAARLLPTSAERRRARRLFYALSPGLLARLHPAEQPQAERFKEPKDSTCAADLGAAGAPGAIRPSRFRKPETTKETGTKSIRESFGKAESKQRVKGHSFPKAARPKDEGCGCLRSLTPPPAGEPPGASSRPEPPELAPFLRFYQEQLTRHQGGHEEPDALGPEDRARLLLALDCYGSQRLEQLAQVFFGSESALLHRQGYRLPAFLEVLPTLSILRLKPPCPDPRPVLGAGRKGIAEAPQWKE